MAALDLTAPSVFPLVTVVTLSGTANRARLVNLPVSADVDLWIRPRANPAKFLDASNTYAEDADASANANYATLAADTWTVIPYSRHGGSAKAYLASGTTSLVVEVMLARRSTPA